jgi:hypothetical protein
MKGLGFMGKHQIVIYALVFLAGVVLAGKVRSLPGGNKLPSF